MFIFERRLWAERTVARMASRPARRGIALAQALLLTSCGLFEPSYRDEGAVQAKAGLTQCEQAALAEFKAEIQPTIESICVNCHGSIVPQRPYAAGDPAANRLQLLDFTKGDPSKLYDKISLKNQSHGGGDQSPNLPLTNIQSWLAKEAECT